MLLPGCDADLHSVFIGIEIVLIAIGMLVRLTETGTEHDQHRASRSIETVARDVVPALIDNMDEGDGGDGGGDGGCGGCGGCGCG
jgi:hypothetical protein